MPSRCVYGILALLLGACATTLPQSVTMNAPPPSAVFTRTPEPGYRIPEAARTKLPPAIDAEVLEALLARVRPEYRAEMLDTFQQISVEAQGRPVAFGPMVANTGDPEIDALVRRVRRVPPSEAGRKQ